MTAASGPHLYARIIGNTTVTSEEILSLDGRKAWRRWLGENHHRSAGVWLTIHKKHIPHGIKLDEAVEEAICFGWIDSRMRSLDNDTFILRFTPRRKNSPWSLANRNIATRMVKEGRITDAGRQAIEEAVATGKWHSAYSSRTKPPMPDDLAEALRVDQVAWDNFNSFTNSRQMALIFWVNSAKRPGTRTKRIEDVVRRARMI
jgi:uncharacterized protein YdeI (YjbR/CyaY-like superfamily)